MKLDLQKCYFLTILFFLLYANSYAVTVFKPAVHKKINSEVLIKLLNDLNLEMDKGKLETCKTRLIRSQSLQDLFLPSQSKAHFDNCAFQKSFNYINRIKVRNEKLALEYKNELKEKESQRELDLLRRKILFNSGKTLHAIQDFYSHSNYIELMNEFDELEDIPTPKFWESESQKDLIKLQEKGLVSGVAWWVFPKKCPKNSLSHAELAKDNEDYERGKVKSKWLNFETKEQFSNFEVAKYLAEKSTYEFLLHTFNKYPMLKSYCANQPINE